MVTPVYPCHMPFLRPTSTHLHGPMCPPLEYELACDYTRSDSMWLLRLRQCSCCLVPLGCSALQLAAVTVRKSGNHTGSPRGGGPATAQLRSCWEPAPTSRPVSQQVFRWFLPDAPEDGESYRDSCPCQALPPSSIRKQNKCHHWVGLLCSNT